MGDIPAVAHNFPGLTVLFLSKGCPSHQHNLHQPQIVVHRRRFLRARDLQILRPQSNPSFRLKIVSNRHHRLWTQPVVTAKEWPETKEGSINYVVTVFPEWDATAMASLRRQTATDRYWTVTASQTWYLSPMHLRSELLTSTRDII